MYQNSLAPRKRASSETQQSSPKRINLGSNCDSLSVHKDLPASYLDPKFTPDFWSLRTYHVQGSDFDEAAFKGEWKPEEIACRFEWADTCLSFCDFPVAWQTAIEAQWLTSRDSVLKLLLESYQDTFAPFGAIKKQELIGDDPRVLTFKVQWANTIGTVKDLNDEGQIAVRSRLQRRWRHDDGNKWV